MKAGERRSDVESEGPTDVDDMVFSEEEESREVIVTSAERRDPTVMSAGDEQEVERRMVVPVPRKRAASDAVTAPLGGIAGLVPACHGCCRASRVVRGADWHPCVTGTSASARLVAGGCPTYCSGRGVLSRGWWRPVGRAGASWDDSTPG